MSGSCKTFLLVLLSVGLTQSMPPPGHLLEEDFHNTGVSPNASELIEGLQTHDPLENRGVALGEVRLIQGDIRWRSDQQMPNYTRETPEAMAGYSEGISFERKSSSSSARAPPSHMLRNAKPFRDEIWTDRIIPYQLDDDLNSTERAIINQAMIEVMEGSGHCITLVERSNQHDFIYITGKIDGCYGDVGRQGGNQTLSVSRTQGCMKKGIVMHELMHILGFWHEHTRHDRDHFIKIHNESIDFGHFKDFEIQQGNLLNISYDYYSILHYATNTFSRNRMDSRQNTIEILDHTVQEDEVGQRKKLSDKDQQRIKALYECPNTKCTYPKKLNDGSVQVTNTSVGSRILYSCTSTDLVLVGAAERTCLFDGTWSGSLPLCFRLSANWFYCDFETPGLCGWTQDTTDEADWTRGSSQTESIDTGPMVDHTKQNSEGHYMYFEGTDVHPNSSARLLSPLIQPEPGSHACVFFWYNMYGKGMGTMKVWLQHDDGRTDLLWSLSGNQNFGWKMQLTHPINVSANYRVVIEGIRGSLDTTDMAIDDVMVGPCDEIESYKNAVIREHKEGANP